MCFIYNASFSLLYDIKAFCTLWQHLHILIFSDFFPANNCGRSQTASGIGGRITTPGYPNDYFDNLDCMWELRSTDNTEVFLNITAGETETEHDYIQVKTW